MRSSPGSVRLIELLAPARNLECGMAAINHGADAVYIGASRFGARKQAGNSVADIAALIRHAHLYRAKVYVALNTILYDDELIPARDLIWQLYDQGADAIIVQDMGVLEMDLPPIPLHASTQTDNRSAEKVLFLEKAGFDQVVLARELSSHQIREIRSKTSVKLECFVHGALCVSYSGQCYMSEAINHRSANRGECAQPCRLPYSFQNSRGEMWASDKHLLSLKDMNLSDYLSELIDAGVDSLKIEGRLKDVDYVKNITLYYRQLLDGLFTQKNGLKKSSSGAIHSSFTPDPSKSFSRGFTTYFFSGRNEEIWSVDTPKSLGEKIGKIARVDKNTIELARDAVPLNNGDGICFFTRKKELVGTRVNKAEGLRIFPDNMTELYAGATLFRNNDVVFNQILSRSDEIRKIGLDICFRQMDDETFQLTLTDEDGIQTIEQTGMSVQPARNESAASESIRNQLSKTGGTPFVAMNTSVNVLYPVFIAAKEVNELRRKAIASHLENRMKSYVRDEKKLEHGSHPFPEKTIGYNGNVVNHLARRFYEHHGAEVVHSGFELMKERKSSTVMTTRHCILHMLDRCIKSHPDVAKQQPFLLTAKNGTFEVTFDCKACEMNIRLRD